MVHLPRLMLRGLLLILLLTITTTGFAEERKNEWKDRNYPFPKMKIILWYPSITVTASMDDIRRRMINDDLNRLILQDETKKLSRAGLNFMSVEELSRRIEGVTGENMSELAKNNPSRYNELLLQYTALYCTNILQVKVTAFGETRHFVPEKVETYETQKQVTIRKTVVDSSGHQVEINETITVPVTESRVIPAHYRTVGHAGMEYTILDVASSQPVWQMVDIREAPDKEPDGMLQRIINRGVERLAEVKK